MRRALLKLCLAFVVATGVVVSCAPSAALPPIGNGQTACNNGEGGSNNMGADSKCLPTPLPTATPTPTPTGAPTPTPTPVPTPTPPGGLLNFQKIYAYAQSTTACGGGWDGFSQQTAQDVFYALELCNSDPDVAAMQTKCPSGGNCRIVLYLSPSLIECGPSYQNANYTALFNSPGTNDAAFLHTSATHTAATRLFVSGGVCTTTGGTSGGTNQVPVNVGTSPQQQYVLTTYEQGAGWNAGSTWNWLFFDNLAQVPSGVIANTLPDEWPGLSSWNSAVQAFVSAESPYLSIANALGPGGGAYGPNNSTAANAELVTNWAVSDKCAALSTTNLRAEMAEKVVDSSVSGALLWYPHNVKVLLNTASQHWNTNQCIGTDIVITGFSGLSGTTSLPARMLAKVLEALSEPNNYNGLSTTSSVETQLFSENVSSLAYQSVFPESELVETNPVGSVRAWCWGGTATCDGNGQVSSAALGNGCYGTNGDTGGATDLARLCGTMGSDLDGGIAPVYAREFLNTYRLGSLIGPSAYVLNMSTTANAAISSLGLSYNYPYLLTPTGNEIPYDPLQAGTAGPLCNPATNCTGAYALTAVPSSQSVPHCVYGSGSATMTGAAQTNGSCAAVLIGWNPQGAQLSIAQQCNSAGTGTCVFTSAPTNAHIMVAMGFDGLDTPGCSSGWTLIKLQAATFDDAIACYKIVNGDTATISPFTATAANISIHAWEVANQDGFTPIDASVSSESATAAQNALTLFLPTYHDVILGGSATNQNVTGFGVPTSWASDGTGANGGLSYQFAHFTPAGVDNRTDTWTYAGDTHVVTAMEVAIRTTNGLATPTPAPSPTPTPVPTPTPTPTPPPAGGTFYDGCPVFTYTGIESTDPYNTDITGASIDPNSSAILSALPNDTLDGAGGFEAPNLATNSTPLFTVQTTSSHNPPLYNTTTEPWVNGFFIGTTNDNHAQVLNTQACVVYEAYKQAWTAPSGPLKAYSGEKWTLNAQFVQGPASQSGASMASDLPLFAGMIRWNGELSLPTPVITHALNFAYPTGQGVSQWGYVFPASSATGIACTGTCTHPLHYGTHLRLHASVTCPTNGQALAVCNALKKYGMFYADQGSPALYFDDADGQGAVNPYSSAIATWLRTIHITDFDVLTQPAVTCQSGHAGCT